MVQFYFDRVENVMEKGEDVDYHNFKQGIYLIYILFIISYKSINMLCQSSYFNLSIFQVL